MLLLLLLLLIATIEVHSLSGCVQIGTVKGWKNLATEEIPHSNLRFVSAEVRDEKWLVEKSGDQLYKVLNPAFTHDADRRHVVVHMTKNQNWVIIPDERYQGYYKLKHYRLGEVLFESVQSWNGNYIFTWIPKRIINDGGASWNITWVSHGVYILKNKKFGHCLWTKGADDWVGAYGGCDHEEYQWKIRKLPCGVGES